MTLIDKCGLSDVISFVTIAKKVSELIMISSYEQNKKQSKKRISYILFYRHLNKLISQLALSKDH